MQIDFARCFPRKKIISKSSQISFFNFADTFKLVADTVLIVPVLSYHQLAATEICVSPSSAHSKCNAHIPFDAVKHFDSSNMSRSIVFDANELPPVTATHSSILQIIDFSTFWTTLKFMLRQLVVFLLQNVDI